MPAIQNVLYVPENRLRMVINHDWLIEMLGPENLPLRPILSITYEEAMQMNLSMKVSDGKGGTKLVPYREYDRYEKWPGHMANAFEKAQLMVYLEETPNGPIGMHDFIELDDSPTKGSPNPVMAPLEWRFGQWWIHFHAEQRPLMGGYSAGLPGGYAQNMTSAAAMRVELKEEWGEAKVIATFFPEYSLTWSNRATYKRPQRNGCFVFEGGTWVPSRDPGGNEIIATKRFAIPLKATARVLFQDNVVAQAAAFARSCEAAGFLAPHEPGFFSPARWF